MDTKHIGKHLTLSTAHITQQDMRLLETRDFAAMCAPFTYGAIVFVLGYNGDRDEEEAFILDLQRSGLSKAFCNVYRLAWEQNVNLILLDRDEEVIDTLPTFEW